MNRRNLLAGTAASMVIGAVSRAALVSDGNKSEAPGSD